ncbi:MAG: cupin [Paucimonas sp.]|nr:cupin [Paucimonas sp.]
MADVLAKQGLVRKTAGTPDEERPFAQGMGSLKVFKLGDATIGRGEFKPGWRWSSHVKPIVGTDSCQASHTGTVLSGSMCVRMDSGEEATYREGDFFYMHPGHDAWVVGDQPCVMLDFTGAADYARPH